MCQAARPSSKAVAAQHCFCLSPDDGWNPKLQKQTTDEKTPFLPHNMTFWFELKKKTPSVWIIALSDVVLPCNLLQSRSRQTEGNVAGKVKYDVFKGTVHVKPWFDA